MKSDKKTKRAYRRITPATVAKHKADILLAGNGTAAIRENEPDYRAPDKRSQQILSKTPDQNTVEYIETSLQQIGATAIQRLNELVQSEDERVAGVNTRYAIDQLRGKAVTKSVSLVGKVNIQSVLD